MLDKWDRRFYELAQHVAQWSKDPSTRVGAVIVDDLRRVVSLGYNGFPRGVPDHPEWLADRDTKLRYTVHAEMNAVLNSAREVRGCTLYTWPLPSCSDCAKLVVQAGVRRVVGPAIADLPERWRDSCLAGRMMLLQAGVECVEVRVR